MTEDHIPRLLQENTLLRWKRLLCERINTRDQVAYVSFKQEKSQQQTDFLALQDLSGQTKAWKYQVNHTFPNEQEF